MHSGTPYTFRLRNYGDEAVCFVLQIDGKALYWKHILLEDSTKVVEGLRDGDKLYPFLFDATPLATTTAAATNQAVGSFKVEVRDTIKINPIMATSNSMPEGRKLNLNDSTSKKTAVVGTS